MRMVYCTPELRAGVKVKEELHCRKETLGLPRPLQ